MVKRNTARHPHGDGHLPTAAAPPHFVGRDVLGRHAWSQVVRALGLSPREFEIVLRLFDDATEADIAEELNLSQYTVHSHLRRVYEKAGVASRVQLVIDILAAFIGPCGRS